MTIPLQTDAHLASNMPTVQFDPAFERFLNREVLSQLDIDAGKFWTDFAALLARFAPRNAELLAQRQQLQEQIDRWYRQQPRSELGVRFTAHDYQAFLREIGYLLPEGESFAVATADVDREVAEVAGPQLVVPLKNARFALNAANARWGSLYDALYGTDCIAREAEQAPEAEYNPVRGAEVIAFGREFLDSNFALERGSHRHARRYCIHESALRVELQSGDSTTLRRGDAFIGYRGDTHSPDAILLRHHGLHVAIVIDPGHPVGRTDGAGVADVLLESAITTIMDCEDSVAAVDVEDKLEVYGNWLGLMQGTLTAEFSRGGKAMVRSLNRDRCYQGRDGNALTLPGRALLFNRNVGLLMHSELALLDQQEVPEHLIDAVVTALISKIDLDREGGYGNSSKGSIYIVKPKMHGPEEVGFVCELFAAVEELLGLAPNCIKLGIMDEERRTSANLSQCIARARQRVVFINTGFLDRTGDEIHTSMEAGAFLPKEQIKQQGWIKAYENRNVSLGLAAGLSGRGQIGKGMWAMPDEMARMLKEKEGHPRAGATTAWVPSPTAATLHALHYHRVDVFALHDDLRKGPVEPVEQLLALPLLKERPDAATIARELDNNIQSILGYVVRWVEQGIGCSKVPDVTDTGLMEDRATLRISAKHVANWLRWGLCSEPQVRDALLRMAEVVDQQNKHDPNYRAMATDPANSPGFQAATALIFESSSLPNGYTEPVLHRYRQMAKQAGSSCHSQ
jgi:malate synthase